MVVKVPHAFALGRREVTRGEYAKFIAEAAYEPKPGCRSLDVAAARYRQDRTRSWQNPLVPAVPEDSHPVSCVSFADAQAYAQWLARKTSKAYRLPSEGEWEYAARAGSDAAYFFGPNDSNIDTYGWYKNNSSSQVQRVGRKSPNVFGLHDMSGNVSEWTSDCKNGNYSGAPNDGSSWLSGDCSERVLRGGAWDDISANLKSAARTFGPVGSSSKTIGIRLARKP
jgi:formylglycine-generating enzyme required for sulfatase activity